MYYCTLDEAKHAMAANNSTQDSALLEKIRQVSRRVDLILAGRTPRPYFGPYIEQRKFGLDGTRVRSADGTFKLTRQGHTHSLLAFTAVTADGSDVTSVTEGYPQDISPITRLRLTNDCNWYDYISSSSPAYVAVTGSWGYHGDWSNAWLAYATLGANITASATALTIKEELSAADPWGITPLISPGALLRLGTEYLIATATTAQDAPALDQVTVRRAQLGSTAAAHNEDDVIYAFQVEEPVRREVARQAGLLESQRGNYQRANVGGVGIIEYPTDLLEALARVLEEYSYV